LLTGRPPFNGDSSLEVLLAHAEKTVPDLRMFRADVVDDLAAIHQRLLAKRPDDRFASADQLLDALNGLSFDAAVTSDAPIPPPIGNPSCETIAGPAANSTVQIDRQQVAARPSLVNRATRPANSRRLSNLSTFVIALGLIGTTVLLLTVIVILQRGQTVTVAEDDHGGTTIHVESDLPGKTSREMQTPPSAQPKRVERKEAAPQENVPSHPPIRLNSKADSEERDAKSGENSIVLAAPTPNPIARLSQQINEIRNDIEQRKRAGEFGIPPDTNRMQEVANQAIADRQRDGRLSADQTIVIKYDANGFFSFTATKGLQPGATSPGQPGVGPQASPTYNQNDGGGGFGRGFGGGGFKGGGSGCGTGEVRPR
jgi:hypothetical protein